MQLYIVDDDPLVAQAIDISARSIGFQCRIFSSANAFLDELDELEHGCVLLDIRLPGMSGLELLDNLTDRRRAWPVVMLTGYAEVDSAVRSFRSGAVHFLSKPFKKAALLDALKEAEQIGMRRIREAVDPKVVEALRTLTRREREILSAISEGMQSKAIAWDLGISIRTVDLHRSNIIAKLSARNTSQAVAMAKACGFGVGS